MAGETKPLAFQHFFQFENVHRYRHSANGNHRYAVVDVDPQPPSNTPDGRGPFHNGNFSLPARSNPWD